MNRMMMNAVRHTARTASQRRFQSSKVSTTFITAPREYSFKKEWLSDAGTYPIMIVLGTAGLLCAGVGSACLTRNPDVQFSPTKRNSIIRTWGLHN